MRDSDRERQANGKTNRGNSEAFAEDHLEYITPQRSESHAYSNFAAAVLQPVRQRSIETGCDQHNCEYAECDCEAGEQHRRRIGLLELRSLSHGLLQGKIWIDLADGATNLRYERKRLQWRSDFKRNLAGHSHLRKRLVDGWPFYFGSRLVLAVSDDANDFGIIDGVPQCTLFKVLVSKRLIHNYDGFARRRIG